MRLVTLSKLLVAMLAISCTVASSAFAEGSMPPPPPGTLPMGLELTTVDAAARTVHGIQHCVDPSRAGQRASFAVAPHVDMSFMAVGKWIGVLVDSSATIVGAIDKDCRTMTTAPPPPGGFGPGMTPPPPGDYPSPPEGQEMHGEDGHEDGGQPKFQRGFLNRVWKFVAETDGFENGVLSVTVAKILNLPKKWRSQDDELVDEDARVLVGKSVRVYEDGERVGQDALDESEHIRVQGKLLPPAKWVEDEDGQTVTTIRAKKVYVID